MSVEAFHVFLSVVVVFKTCETSFMKKSSILAWGLPAVIVIITLAINSTNNYIKIAEVTCLLCCFPDSRGDNSHLQLYPDISRDMVSHITAKKQEVQELVMKQRIEQQKLTSE
ncbi:adhesion G-protein coupled receptor G6-like [Octopus vulgaris]|uniref:Adhesion G-protein coupled receptor G6-like n=1 Tax=Octopus vulgaris TaxID=6645 RepID=A0AA36C1D2_OCTVU|nr:adhesion G-protein coupled receptor G6-like [Octopus vulgaris]